MVRVILVDPRQRQVTEKQVDARSLEAMQALVNGPLEMYSLANLFPRHAMYLDEEGKLKAGRKFFWRLRGKPDLFCGYGVVFRTDGRGGEIDAAMDPYDVEQCVEWLGETRLTL